MAEIRDKFTRMRERIYQRFAEARTPKPDWALFNDQEKARRLEEQRQQAVASNKAEVENFSREINRAITTTRATFEKGLRPSTFSDLQSERSTGHYFENRAYRYVKEVGADKIESEYRWAMQSGLTDYATELLNWAITLVPEKNLVARNDLETLKKQHVEALGLGEVNRSLSELNATQAELDALSRQIAAGIDRSPAEAQDFQAWAQIAELQGLVAS